MTTLADHAHLLPRTPPTGREAGRIRFPARHSAESWPATCQTRDAVWDALTRAPFVVDNAHTQKIRLRGLTFLLDWLEDQPGRTWQERWLASGADAAGAGWRKSPARWLQQHGLVADWRLDALASALLVAISADLVRPALGWLVAKATGPGSLVRHLAHARDPDGFARLRALCDADPHVSSVANSHTLHRAAEILATKGGRLADVTVGDVLELLDAELDTLASVPGDAAVFYRLLRTTGVFGPDAPSTLREIRGSAGPRTPEELIDRYRCSAVRSATCWWTICVNASRRWTTPAWKASPARWGRGSGGTWRSTIPASTACACPTRSPPPGNNGCAPNRRRSARQTGEKVTVDVPRLNYRECLIPVRAFYLDLAQWAVDDPGRWAQWAVPCPIKERRGQPAKAQAAPQIPHGCPHPRTAARSADAGAHRQSSTAKQPTRSCRQPANTQPGAAVHRSRADADPLRHPPRRRRRQGLGRTTPAPASDAISNAKKTTPSGPGRSLKSCAPPAFGSRSCWSSRTTALCSTVCPPPTKSCRCCRSCHPRPMRRRLLLVSPELADVLSTVIQRVRDHTGKIPLITSYDWQECVWLPPSPLLFQRRFGAERRRISPDVIRDILAAALVRTGLTDPTTGEPLRFTPHDFRRLFITDAIMSGLPPHIAQVIAGHRDLNVTMGYKAVYPDEAIQSHLAFLSRRRAMRPTDEYRVPTDAEWQEFLGHFERRKVSTGICGRAVGTPCVHEHSCLRCSMHWPDPAQRHRIAEIRDNLIARIAEAEREGWLGEVEGLQISLAGAQRQTRPNRPALDRHRCRPRPARHTTPENLMDATPFLVQRSRRLANIPLSERCSTPAHHRIGRWRARPPHASPIRARGADRGLMA